MPKRISVVLLLFFSAWCSSKARSQAPAEGPVLVPPTLLEGTKPALPDGFDLKDPKSVVLELTVDEQGSVRDPTIVTSAGEELDRLALEATASMRFAPATRNGLPIAARIPFRFDFAPAPAPPPPVERPNAPPEGPLPPEQAAEPASSEPITLDVRGERPPREPTAHRIDAATVRTVPGTNGDALRAIETMPGVARPPGLTGQLVVRGSAPEDSAVFVDGIFIPNAYHFGGLSSVIPTEALDRLDFRPGNFGAEYGRAMGGVVELGLRSPRADRIAGLAQVDSLDARVLAEGPLGKRTRFLVGARRSWVDAWLGQVLNSDDISLRTAPVYWDGQALLEHDLTRRTRARLSLIAADDRLVLISRTPSAQDPGLGGRFAGHTRFTRAILRFDSELSERVHATNTLALGRDRFEFSSGSDFSDIGVYLLQTRSELSVDVAPWLRTTGGLDVQAGRYDVEIRTKPYPTTDETAGPYFARPSQVYDEQPWLLRPAVYALAEVRPIPAVRVVPGVRADYTQDTERVTLDPRVTARADVHDAPRTTLKGGLGLYHQPPQPQESVEPFGSPGVRSNRATHASLGVEQEIVEGLTLSLEGFGKRFSDLVVASAAEDTDALANFRNTGSGRAYGSEVLLRYTSARASGWVAYTLSRSERKNRDSEPYHPFAWDQTHVLTALGSVEVGLGITLGARFRYVTGNPYTPYVGGVVDLDAGAYAAVPSSDPYSARLPAFMALDLRIEKAWKFDVMRLLAYAELRNATNRENAEAVSYRYDYGAHKVQPGLPILPVIGLRGEL